jgi:hypothetical protein
MAAVAIMQDTIRILIFAFMFNIFFVTEKDGLLFPAMPVTDGRNH